VNGDADPIWWYESGGRQAGPETAAALRQLLVSGRVTAATRVWRSGMAGWEPIGQVAELAPMLQAVVAAIPPLQAPPLAPLAAGAPAVQAPGAGVLEEIPVGVLILLTVVTFGIYGLVKFYQTGKAYERLAGRESRFTLYFWLFVGLAVLGFFLNAATGFLGIPLAIAALVFQVLTLDQALDVREEGMRRFGITVPVTSGSKHKIYLVLGMVLSVILVGLVFTLIQAIKWFQDWNAIGRAARGRVA
jgi:GYF domain 2